MSDGPSAFRAVWRKARKPHRCCECWKAIQKGTVYEYASGIWDGEPSSFKTCRRCTWLRKAHEDAIHAANSFYDDPGYTLGNVISEIGDRTREDHMYRKAFRAAYRAAKETGRDDAVASDAGSP